MSGRGEGARVPVTTPAGIESVREYPRLAALVARIWARHERDQAAKEAGDGVAN